MNTDISAGAWAVDGGGGMAGCAVYTVYAPILLAPGTVLIKCCDFQRSLLARSIRTCLYWQQEGPMFSYSLYVVCCLYVTLLLPLERAPKAGPCHLFSYLRLEQAGAGIGGPLLIWYDIWYDIISYPMISWYHMIKFYNIISYHIISYYIIYHIIYHIIS